MRTNTNNNLKEQFKKKNLELDYGGSYNMLACDRDHTTYLYETSGVDDRILVLLNLVVFSLIDRQKARDSICVGSFV